MPALTPWDARCAWSSMGRLVVSMLATLRLDQTRR
jgi:hypothetical protein